MTFAERLRQLRIEKKMTLEEVGKRIGVGRANVYKYEHGIITNIPPEKAKMLAEMFGVSVQYLMGWTDKRGVSLPDQIPLPDNEMFVKAYSVMSSADRSLLIDIFNRAYIKLKMQEPNKK